MVLPVLGPLLATLATNGMGLLADAITQKGKDFVEDKLGVALTPNPTAEDLAKWKEAVLAHERELIQMAYADVADARAMQVEALKQDDLFSKRFVYYYAWFWSVCAGAYIFCITFFDVPKNSVRFADTILGFLLGTIVPTIIYYYFGSSDGSRKKSDVLESVAGKKLVKGEEE